MKMANRKLGRLAIESIREAIAACTDSKEISAEAERLASQFEVHKDRIYALTKDLREKRKPRADKGTRTADLMTHPSLSLMAGWCVHYDIKPEEAFDLARGRGLEIPVELDTFRRYMREHDLSKQNRNKSSEQHRSFEAAHPGAMFQFDISGTKQRWFDTKTRRIITVSDLEVSENHPNQKANRVRVWRFKLIDDKPRFVFSRYYGVDKPNSSHVIDFLLQAYSHLGVPLKLYTDNDAIIKFGRNAAATKTINQALADCGGYEVIHHLPGNARATGKIERQHQNSEATEKLIGLFLAEGRELTIDQLNVFAANADARYNNTRHRTTGEKPVDRRNAEIHTIRTLDYEVLKSAFLADEFEITLKGNLSFDIKGKKYQLPTDQRFQDLYERSQSTKQKLTVIFADKTDFFTLVDFDLNEYDIPKTLAAPDVAGDYKSTAESKGQINRKTLKKVAKEDAAMQKERQKIGIKPAYIPNFDNDVAAEIVAHAASDKTNVAQFPTPNIDVTPQLIEALPAGRAALVQSSANLFSFWNALRGYENRFSDKAECKQFLDTVFPTREDQLPQSEIETALRALDKPQRILRAV